MIILPHIKADYDDYIHFNHIRCKNRAFYIYLHSILHVFTSIYRHNFYSFVLMMLSSPESEKSIRLISTVCAVLGLNCIG